MSVDLSPAAFGSQMADLAGRAAVATIDQAVDELGNAAGPERVVVTFDDGTADWVGDVLPVLDRFRVPATFYVATDFVERGIEFPHGGRPISWAGLGELCSSGLATIGSHTHTHALLDRATGEEAAAELDRSRGLIEDRLGIACRHFAYPKAQLGSPAAEAEVRSRFASAAIGGSRPNPYGRTDAWRLTRTPIQTADTDKWFRRKATGGLRLEGRLRELVDRRRYAGATT